MPQRVPAFTFSDDALKVRQFLYDYWCEQGSGPNLYRVHEATGLSRERIAAAYQELDLGLICVVDPQSQNSSLLKLQPFSSYPSQVEVHVDGKFRAYAGCAMESIAISRMPPYAGKELRLESYCSCCLEPVTLVMRDGDVVSVRPEALRIHVSSSPREWNRPSIVAMCDSMNFVSGPEHAEIYERKISRRGVLFTLDQARKFVSDTAKNRMWRYDWPPVSIDPEKIIAGIRGLGIDVTNWGG
jgi:hypothetical protein